MSDEFLDIDVMRRETCHLNVKLLKIGTNIGPENLVCPEVPLYRGLQDNGINTIEIK